MTNSKPRQMAFGFDESPHGAEPPSSSDESEEVDETVRTPKPRCRPVKRPAREARASGLYARIAAVEPLEAALRKVASNKGAPGPDRQSVEIVVAHKATVLNALSQSLLNGSYQPGDIRRCWIPKPGGGSRGLGIPNVVDRIVQEAVRQVLEPIFEPYFHPSSHGFRPERSCHTAIAEASTYVHQDGMRFVVDLDLKTFFDRVPHQRLLDRMQLWIADLKLIRLIGKMLRAKVVFPDGKREAVIEGVPQGGPLSPLLSNIVLDELDWELERRGHRFVRYADDCNIYVGSLRAGERASAKIRRFIETHLRLEVNLDKSAVAPAGERHFLGFQVSKGPSGELVIELSKRSRDRLARRLRELTPRNAGQSMPAVIRRVNTYLRGWMGFFGICTETGPTLRLLSNYSAHIRRRLRASFVRRYRRPRDFIRALVTRGAPRGAARAAVRRRRGPWYLSHCFAVERALPNAFFREAGLLDLSKLWAAHPARSTAGPAPAG